MTISEYLTNVSRLYKAGHATEHSYRADLQKLIETLAPGVQATNEPKRQTCGAPDYILNYENDMLFGYIEAKGIDNKNLGGLKKNGGNKEQFKQYRLRLEICYLPITCIIPCTRMGSWLLRSCLKL